MPIVGRPFILGSGSIKMNFDSNDAVLCVKSKSGLSIIASKSGVSKRLSIELPIIGSDESYYYCSIKSNLFDSINEWEVSTIFDNDRYLDYILIDSAAEYHLTLGTDVPYGYTKLSYIKFPGQDAIIIPNPWVNFSFAETYVIDFKHGPETLSTSRYPGIFGNIKYVNGNPWFAYPTYKLSDYNTSGYKGFIAFPAVTNNTSGQYYARFDRTDNGSDIALTITAEPSSDLSHHNIFVRGDRTSSCTSYNEISPGNVDFRIGSSGIGATNGFGGKIYYFKLTRNNVVTLDLIPCKNSLNVYGFYDKPSKTFYTTDGLTGGE